MDTRSDSSIPTTIRPFEFGQSAFPPIRTRSDAVDRRHPENDDEEVHSFPNDVSKSLAPLIKADARFAGSLLLAIVRSRCSMREREHC